MRKQADTAYDFVNESASSMAGRKEGHLVEICWKKKKIRSKKRNKKTEKKTKKGIKNEEKNEQKCERKFEWKVTRKAGCCFDISQIK